jgi:hypothetical protein
MDFAKVLALVSGFAAEAGVPVVLTLSPASQEAVSPCAREIAASPRDDSRATGLSEQ